MLRRTPALLALALLVTLSACAIFTKGVARPTVDVRGVAVGEISFSGLEGQINLDVTNPNGFGVPLASIEWQLSVGGSAAVSGTIELSETIPAHGVAPVVASLRIGASQAINVASAIAAGTRTYELTARLHFTSPLGPITVDVGHTGELSDAGALARR